MKFRKIFRFELTYQLRRFSPWLYFAVLAFFAFAQTVGGYLPGARSCWRCWRTSREGKGW